MDAHPEYLLIMNSDHGRSRHGYEDGIHGKPGDEAPGNDGIQLFYHRTLPSHCATGSCEVDESSFPIIWQWDVAATIARYLNLNIPLQNVGLVAEDYDDVDPYGLYRNCLQLTWHATLIKRGSYNFSRCSPTDAASTRKYVDELHIALYEFQIHGGNYVTGWRKVLFVACFVLFAVSSIAFVLAFSLPLQGCSSCRLWSRWAHLLLASAWVFQDGLDLMDVDPEWHGDIDNTSAHTLYLLRGVLVLVRRMATDNDG